MSIDWSKAPEGATHAEPKGYLMFYKQEDKEWMYFSDSDDTARGAGGFGSTGK